MSAGFCHGVVERFGGFPCVYEDAPRIHVERTQQPAADRRRDRNAHQYVAESPEVFRVTQRTSGKHRDRDQRGLRNVNTPIEPGAAGREWDCNAKFFPITLRRKSQLLDCGAEHVIGNPHAAVGEQDTLGRNRTMSKVPAVTMERGERGEHFLQQELRSAVGRWLTT